MKICSIFVLETLIKNGLGSSPLKDSWTLNTQEKAPIIMVSGSKQRDLWAKLNFKGECLTKISPKLYHQFKNPLSPQKYKKKLGLRTIKSY